MESSHDCFCLLALCFYALSPLPASFLLQCVGDQRRDGEKEVNISDLTDRVKVLPFWLVKFLPLYPLSGWRPGAGSLIEFASFPWRILQQPHCGKVSLQMQKIHSGSTSFNLAHPLPANPRHSGPISKSATKMPYWMWCQPLFFRIVSDLYKGYFWGP